MFFVWDPTIFFFGNKLCFSLTALRTSSRCPSTPPNMATNVSVWMFHRRRAWSAERKTPENFTIYTQLGHKTCFYDFKQLVNQLICYQQDSISKRLLVICFIQIDLSIKTCLLFYLCWQTGGDLDPSDETWARWWRSHDQRNAEYEQNHI